MTPTGRWLAANGCTQCIVGSRVVLPLPLLLTDASHVRI